MAEMTWLTILGSPSGSGARDRDRNQARSDGGDANRDGQDANRKNADNKSGDANRGRSGDAFGSRRRVYHIAVGPDTLVHRQGGDRRKDSGDAKGRDDAAAGNSRSDLEQLQLGDRIRVEFTRLDGRGKSASDDSAQASNPHAKRHGRHHVIRGMARSITILSSPDQGAQKGAAGQGSGDDSGSDNDKSGSGSGSQGKKNDQEK